MISFRFDRGPRRFAWIVAALVLAGLVGREHRTRAQGLAIKLTTVLADVASVVHQDDPSLAPSAAPAAIDPTSLPKSARDAMYAHGMRLDPSGAVQVYVLMSDMSVSALQRLAGAGATIQTADAPHERVQAAIPLSRLTAVAALPFVNFIRLPNYAIRRTGSVDTEGDAILHADVARAQFNVDGTGVNVGVISDGLKGVFATGCATCNGVANGPISTGDLPASTGTRSPSGTLTASSGGITGKTFNQNGDLEGIIPGCAFAGAGAEGTALLEIVHDLAPGAQLAFANADTDIDFNQAVNALAAANDVVVDDLGFFIPPFDGTNTVSANTAAALNNNANRIRAYVTANGNDADGHYYGSYVDSGVDGTTISGIAKSGHLHVFQSSTSTTDILGLGSQPFNVISMPMGGSVDIFLVWDDPAGHSSNNYDLFLVQQSNNTVVASSTDVQNGSQDPLESIRFTNSGAAGLFHVVVQNVGNQAAVKNLNIISFQEECDANGPLLIATGHHERLNFNTAGNSVIAESDAGGTPVSVISVGAICSASAAAANATKSTDESCLDTSHSTAEFFSSEGPTLDGRVKPDIAAVDGVSITGAGSFENPFFGTSAAAPHIAGEAALVMQAVACLSSTDTFGLDAATARAKLRNLIVSSADARSPSPPDNVFGAGLANVEKAIQASLPIFSGPPALVVSGNVVGGARLTAGQLGFNDPDGCPLQRLSWTGGCGSSPDSAMTCPLGTSNVSVEASNSGTAFSSPTPLQVTVTSFTIGSVPTSATVTAGQSGHYQVSVTPQSGPFANAVVLGCSGLPQGASCTFSPGTVTPGANAAQVALTVTTTAPAEPVTALAPKALTVEATGPDRKRRAFQPASIALGLAVIVLMAACAVGFLTSSVAGAHRRRLAVAAMSAVLAAMALQMACGSKGNSSGTTTVSTNPTSLTFSSQTTGTSAPPQAITVTNTGQSVLTITGVAASGDYSETNTCGTSVAAGGSCAITVTFTPTAAGSRTGTITITDNVSNSPQKVSLTGTGVSATGATPTGSYQVTVNGSSGTLVNSGAITLIVQ
jgi:Subtilase family/Abnormal spindle-like microcephaly-assoc'd, ASPM-SPD-2-Hydin